MGASKAMAREIRETKAEDVLALKGNHPTVQEEERRFLLSVLEPNAGAPPVSRRA